ncbi:MAG: CBS domain-containing protein [Aquabacterium sp.]|nr:CBS domain-containing protein [Aquabacterium sp.]MBP6614605.1 CBS domain-containing protein [Aquabacterium sp.]MBP7501842.1 CBS domain-containing protein [Aquabacterium sp.]MCC6219547.1 CBS domain-containing protein [Aquabacterium sp.]
MTTAADILKSKPNQAIFAIGPRASVYDALQLAADKGVGALLVMEDERVIGIVTERDYARKVALLSRSSKDTAVSEIMTTAVMYVHPKQTNAECMALMTDKRIRHLPVMDEGKLLGLISIGDLVKDIISEQQFIIQQLQHYIAGERA